MRRFLTTFLLATLIGAAVPVHAQIEKTLSVTFNPPLLQLNKRISAELKSPAIDVSTALIVWKLNGTVLGQGIGATETTITLTERTPSSLEVTIVERDGTEMKLVQTLQPSDVDLIWEGVSYTPAFYGGRALVAPGGRVTVSAIPHTNLGSGETLIYSWYQDGTLLGKQSGFGKHTAQIQMPAFGDDTLVRVEVKNMNNEYVGGNGLRINPTPVVLRMYQEKTLVGLWTNTVVGLMKGLDGSVNLRAIPYHIDGSNLGRVRFDWRSDTGDLAVEAQGRAVYTPQKPTGVVTIDVSHGGKLLQEATMKTNIGTTVESSLFGI